MRRDMEQQNQMDSFPTQTVKQRAKSYLGRHLASPLGYGVHVGVGSRDVHLEKGEIGQGSVRI